MARGRNVRKPVIVIVSLITRARKEQIETTFRTLSEEHSDEFGLVCMLMDPSDLETPPNVPAITGEPVKRIREEKVQPLTGAATAITNVLMTFQRSPTPPSSSRHSTGTGISPASKANLSGQCLQQLRENEALTEELF